MGPVITEKQFKETYKLKKFAIKAIKKFGLKFPKYPNKNLVKIVSLLTFDGHLRWDGNVFLFTAGKKLLLKEPMLLVKKEFGLFGKFRKIPTNIYGTSYEYRVTNKPVSRILDFIGVPKGNKVLLPFSVPRWIMKNKEFSRTYVQVAFDCEGTIWKEYKRSFKIRFRINKSLKFLQNGIEFMEDIRNMLLNFNIKTSKIWVIDSNIRKDGNITKGMCFNILAADIPLFKKHIGFTIKHKKKLLNGVGLQHGIET